MATLVEFKCANCGKFNVHKGTATPKYCNAHCYHTTPQYVIAHARAIRAYQLWISGGYTLQRIGNELGGVTRERARQLVNIGREHTADIEHSNK